MSDRYDLRRGVIHRAYAEDIYPTMEPGSVRLVISDGPYGMSKAAWDKMSLDDLPAWYAPHIEAWGRLCMPSASVYLWNTAAGWARLDPVMRAAGWEFRGLIIWDKVTAPALLGAYQATGPVDTIEVCGTYTRGRGIARADIIGPSVWRMPIASFDVERLKEKEASAPKNPKERGPARKSLHPCQKPLTFSDRMIRASTRSGELVLEPFGGTCRVAVACERMPEPEARRYVCIEPDQDGRDYIAAVLPALRLELPAESGDGQIGLFATTPCAPASEPV